MFAQKHIVAVAMTTNVECIYKKHVVTVATGVIVGYVHKNMLQCHYWSDC